MPVVALVEIGDSSVGGIILSTDYRQLYSAVYFQFDESTSKEEILIKLKKDLSIEDFKKIELKVLFNISACVIIPDEFVKSTNTIDQTLSMLHGTNPFSKNLNGSVRFINATIGWRVDYSIAQAIEKHLAADLAKSKHVFQNMEIPSVTGIELTCIVYPDALRVMLFNNQQLLFAGYFAYTDAQDGVYHLLHLVNKYEISAQDINLILGGLVTQESALYAQLNQYFGKINCLQNKVISDHSDLFEPYPFHYFGHLIAHLS